MGAFFNKKVCMCPSRPLVLNLLCAWDYCLQDADYLADQQGGCKVREKL